MHDETYRNLYESALSLENAALNQFQVIYSSKEYKSQIAIYHSLDLGTFSHEHMEFGIVVTTMQIYLQLCSLLSNGFVKELHKNAQGLQIFNLVISTLFPGFIFRPTERKHFTMSEAAILS